MGQPFHFPVVAGWLAGETQVCVLCVCAALAGPDSGGTDFINRARLSKYGRMATLHEHYARTVPLRGGFVAGSKLYMHLRCHC